MYSSTGLSSEQITDLVARIHDLREAPASRAGRKPTLGLYKCVVVALIYLRSNRTQASIADQFHVSQKTISRTIASWMPILGQALQDCTPTVDDLDVSEPLIVDGTLLPTWSWRTMPELYSGKHKTTGVNWSARRFVDSGEKPEFIRTCEVKSVLCRLRNLVKSLKNKSSRRFLRGLARSRMVANILHSGSANCG